MSLWQECNDRKRVLAGGRCLASEGNFVLSHARVIMWVYKKSDNMHVKVVYEGVVRSCTWGRALYLHVEVRELEVC